MNLSQIRNRVQSLANFKADNPDHLAELDDLINRAVVYLTEAQSWTWATKSYYLDVVPDLNSEITGGITVELFNFSRQVDFSGDIFSVIPQRWDDQYLELYGRDYRISKVETGLGHARVILEEPYRGAPAAAYDGWVLKKKDYSLPEDCAEVLSVAHTDSPIRAAERRPIPCLPQRIDELSALEEQRTADYAELYHHLPPSFIPPGEKLGPPLEEPEAVPDSALAEGDEYEICWAFERNGRVGALSLPRTYIVGLSLQDLVVGPNGSLITHDDTPVKCLPFDPVQDRYPSVYEGLRKVLFVNVNYRRRADSAGNPAGRLGNPRWVYVTQATSETIRTQYDRVPKYLEDYQNAFEIGYLAQLHPGNPAYIEVDGHHQQIRFYPRIIGYDVKNAYQEISTETSTYYAPEVYFRQVEVRYRFKPPLLAQETDSPQMPSEMHELIVSKALSDYYLKIGEGALSQLYEVRFDKDVRAFTRRYVTHTDASYQRPLQWGGGVHRLDRLNSIRLRS